MAYADRLLADDEELIADLRPHPVFVCAPAALLVAAVAGVVAIVVELPDAPVAVAWLLAAMAGVPALWLAVRVVRWRSIHLVLTTRRLVYRRGVLGRDVIQLRLQRVAEVHCSQTLLGRVIAAGRLVFEVTGDVPVSIDDVPRPRAVQRLVTRRLDEMAAETAVGYATTGYATTGYATAADATASYPAATTDYSAATAGYPAAADAFGPWGDTPARGVPVHPTGRSPMVSPPPGPSAPPGSVPAQLIQLDDLRRRGILTDEEFAAKKAELLSRL